MIRGGGEAGRVVVEAAVEHGRAVRELALKHIGGRVVQAHLGVPRRHQQVIAVVGEAQVGDAVGRRVGKLPPQQRQRHRRGRRRHHAPTLVVVVVMRGRRRRHCPHHRAALRCCTTANAPAPGHSSNSSTPALRRGMASAMCELGLQEACLR